MEMQLRPLAIDAIQLKGLSRTLIGSHYDNNYTGAVKRLNAIRQQLTQLDWSNAPVFLVNGFKTRRVDRR